MDSGEPRKLCFVETSIRSVGTTSNTFVFDPKTNEIRKTVLSSTSVLLYSAYDLLKSTFLPIGYPHSVRPEYLQYQFWDSIQGISSYLRSVLTTRSVLTGIGVGSSSATPLSAALVWVLRDGMGMIGSLLCAYWYSESFEVYTKEWRLFADVLNNIGLTLDLVSSLIPSQYFFVLTSVSTLSKSCCGLIAGATKAKISAHFALSGHLSDVTVKESTQETAVALCGLVLGTILTKVIGTDDTSTWLVFLVLLCVHQLSNYLLVKVLVFDTLNPQRCYLLTKLSSTSSTAVGSLPTPAEVAALENFYWPFQLSLYGPLLGASIAEALQAVVEAGRSSSSGAVCQSLFRLWEKEPFIVSFNMRGRVIVCLEEGCSDRNMVKAYLLACHIHIHMNRAANATSSSTNRLDYLINTAGPDAIKWFESIQSSMYCGQGSWNVNDYSSMKPETVRFSRCSGEDDKKQR